MNFLRAPAHKIRLKVQKAVQEMDDYSLVCLLTDNPHVNVKDIIDTVDHHGDPLLYNATKYPDLTACLIKAGANLNIKDDEGRTVLISAIRNGRDDLAREMIEAGADLDIKDNDGTTALSISIIIDNLETLDTLIEAGANLDLPGKNALTPLLLAVLSRKHEASIRLIEGGAKLDAIDQTGMTALHWAIALKDDAIARQIINAGADLDKLDANKMPPLVRAMLLGKDNIVGDLLKKGANPSLSWEATTPLDVLKNLPLQETTRTAMAEALIPALFNPRWWPDKDPAKVLCLWEDIPDAWKQYSVQAIAGLSRAFAPSSPHEPATASGLRFRAPSTGAGPAPGA